MHPAFDVPAGTTATPITFVTSSKLGAAIEALAQPARQFVEAAGFEAKPGQCLLLPSAAGGIDGVLFGLEDETAKWRDPFRPGQLPGMLPPDRKSTRLNSSH